jgi:hypothetical protein
MVFALCISFHTQGDSMIWTQISPELIYDPEEEEDDLLVDSPPKVRRRLDVQVVASSPRVNSAPSPREGNIYFFVDSVSRL